MMTKPELVKHMTDKKRLDWLEEFGNSGGALLGLIHNDHRYWAFLWNGCQNVDEEMTKSGGKPFPLTTTFFAGPEDLHRFKLTIREAIDYARENEP